MADVQRAIAHLEDAEVAIMSWWQKIDAESEDEFVELAFSSMLAAVLRSVSRAAGALEADGNVSKPRYLDAAHGANDG